MRTEVIKKLFTVDEFYRMDEAGILDPEKRYELVGGEILEMPAPGPRHVACSLRANTLFTEAFGRRAFVSVQNPLRLDIYNEPLPDIVVLKPAEDFYVSKRVSPEDAFFAVEISDTSLSKDRKLKLPRYAEFQVPEFWIEDLKHKLLFVYRDPLGDTYNTTITLNPGDVVSPLAFPDACFKVEDLLG